MTVMTALGGYLFSGEDRFPSFYWYGPDWAEGFILLQNRNGTNVCKRETDLERKETNSNGTKLGDMVG
jgi:hypothetical protein